jgi:hypothetical protein
MAKQKKVLPARKPRDRSRDDDSLLLRSAESLGRVIGALQRQLDSATRRLQNADGDVIDRLVTKVKESSAARKPRSRKRAASKRKTSSKTKSTKKR